MHLTRPVLSAVAACGLLFSGLSAAQAAPKDYQFTGPVTAMTDTTLSVQKGKETWEFAKDSTTKAPAELKVGDKVTVHYVMNAVSIDPSGKAAAPKAPAAEKVPKKEKAAKGANADAAASPAAEASPKS